MRVVNGMYVNQSILSAVVNVFWNGKRNRKLSIAHTITTVEKGFGTVVVSKRFVSHFFWRLVVLLTSNQFPGVSDGQGNDSVEVVVILYVSRNLGFRTSLHRGAYRR